MEEIKIYHSFTKTVNNSDSRGPGCLRGIRLSANASARTPNLKNSSKGGGSTLVFIIH